MEGRTGHGMMRCQHVLSTVTESMIYLRERKIKKLHSSYFCTVAVIKSKINSKRLFYESLEVNFLQQENMKFVVVMGILNIIFGF